MSFIPILSFRLLAFTGHFESCRGHTMGITLEEEGAKFIFQRLDLL